MDYLKIQNVEALKKAINDGKTDFFMVLGGGGIRSSKTIYHDVESSTFEIHHDIDGSSDTISEEEIEKTNIGEAIRKGCFYAY